MDAYFLGSLLACVESKYFYLLEVKKVFYLDLKERRIEEFFMVYFQHFQFFIELPIRFLIEEFFEMLKVYNALLWD